MDGVCPQCGRKVELRQEANLTVGYCDCSNSGKPEPRIVINFITPPPAPAPVKGKSK